MNTTLRIGMASILALATASPALAQYPPFRYQPAPQYQQTAPSWEAQQQYQQDRRDYEARKEAYDARRETYDARRDDYEVSRADYQAARADYDRRHAAWERARDDYDARYGYGAYMRTYGPAPVWETNRWGPYESPYAGAYGRPSAYVAPPVVTCRNDHTQCRGHASADDRALRRVLRPIHQAGCAG